MIVRFVNRKNCEKALKVKRNLSSVDMRKLNFPVETQIYLNENLNNYFKRINWQCRKLKNGSLIDSYKYQNESFIIKFVVGNGDPRSKKITHESQLFDIFPDFF